MDINHTRKVINSILQDKVTAEDCRKALSELDAMSQAQSDLTKVVSGLEKTRDGMKAEVSALAAKLEEAQVKAADIVAKAQEQATAAIEAAQDTIAVNQSKADKKLMETNDRISMAERKAIVAEGQAKEAADKLAAINAELDAAKARAQKLLGA